MPTDASGLPGEPADPAPGPAARYDRLESVTFAFLLALEALSPAQRAVLLLRDVFDYSVRETADALGDVRGQREDDAPARPARDGVVRRRGAARAGPDAARSGQALERFLACLAAARRRRHSSRCWPMTCASTSDAGGEFAAARREVSRRRRSRTCTSDWQKRAGRVDGRAWLTLNGQPAVELEFTGGPPAGRRASSCSATPTRPAASRGCTR